MLQLVRSALIAPSRTTIFRQFPELRSRWRGSCFSNRRRLGELAFLTVGLMAITGGCMVGPNFKTPPAAVAGKWIEEGNKAVDSGAAEHRDWWTVFNDPALTRLVQLAYERNLTLQTAGVRVLEARARLGIAIGEFYPQQQQVGASLTYNRIPISLPYNFITNTYWADQFGAQAAWELDFWGKLRRAIESADGAFLASVANYDDVLVTLVGDVASAYVKIRTTERQIAIARDNIARQRTALKIASAKFQYGTASKRDVYQAENVLGATEAAIPQLNIQLAQAKNALSVLLGMPPGAAGRFARRLFRDPDRSRAGGRRDSRRLAAPQARCQTRGAPGGRAIRADRCCESRSVSDIQSPRQRRNSGDGHRPQQSQQRFYARQPAL